MIKPMRFIMLIVIQTFIMSSAYSQRIVKTDFMFGGGYAVTQFADIPALSVTVPRAIGETKTYRIQSYANGNPSLNISHSFYVFQSKNLAIQFSGYYLLPNEKETTLHELDWEKVSVDWQYKGGGIFIGISNKYGSDRIGIVSNTSIGYSTNSYSYSTHTSGYYFIGSSMHHYTLEDKDCISMSSLAGLITLGLYVKILGVEINPSAQLIMASNQHGFNSIFPMFSMNIHFISEK